MSSESTNGKHYGACSESDGVGISLSTYTAVFIDRNRDKRRAMIEQRYEENARIDYGRQFLLFDNRNEATMNNICSLARLR